MSDYLTYFQNLDVLNALLTDERAALAEASAEMHFFKDEAILEEGKECHGFFGLCILFVFFVKVTRLQKSTNKAR